VSASRTFRVWRDNEEEWPHDHDPEALGEWDALSPELAAELAAEENQDGEWYSSPAKFIALEVGTERYYEVSVAIAWRHTGATPIDIDSIREKP